MNGGFDPLTAVCDAVAVVCDIEPQSLSRATRFADIGADSLARVSIADVVEMSLAGDLGHSLHIDDASLCLMASLGELADYASSHLDGQ